MAKIIVNGQSVEDAIAGAVAAGTVPVGGVLPWMSPILGAPQPTPPTGFEYCDGTAVTTVGPMFGFTKPALMKSAAAPGIAQRLVRGGNTAVAYGGATALVLGGADTHTHGGNTDNSGAHTHTVTSHTHTISGDGGHTHTNVAGGNFNTSAATGANSTVANHSHGGLTGGSAPTTSAATPTTHNHNLSVSAGANIPSYVELAWIIRVV